MRIALDTNILVYAEGINDLSRRDLARDILNRLPPMDVCVPVQVLGELYHVLTRKARRAAKVAHADVVGWRGAFTTIDTSDEALMSAMDLSTTHQFTIWDSIIVASAAEADCRLLLSEDLQEGFIWRGVTVTNPFSAQRHPLLEGALKQADQQRQPSK